MLKISNLFANIGDVKILNGVDLEIGKGDLHAVMGPNGSGKSTLCHVLMGNPDFNADGEVTLNGSEILPADVAVGTRLMLESSFR